MAKNGTPPIPIPSGSRDQPAGAALLPPIQERSPGPYRVDITPSPIQKNFAGACRKLSDLPQTIPHFVCRVQECSDISGYLCPEHNCKCVLLHGVTGVGKTSTAIKVANDKRDSERPTVVVYVNCRYITSLDDFAKKALQQVYHYPVEDPISELKNRLKSQDCYTVLLLDNFEFLLHLGDIGPDTLHEGAMAQEKTTLPTEGTKIKTFITEIVEISRKVKLLVTSSERIEFPSLGQEEVHLACFTPEESCQLLQTICKERVENQLQCACQLSEICSGIPLVLYTLALSHSDLLSLVERMICSSPQDTFEFLIKIQSVPEEEKINKLLQAIAIREQQTLPIYREHLGDHPFTATILNHLSNNYYALREYDKAKQYSDDALRMRLALLKDHRDTAKSLFDLGMVHKERGELQQAKEYFERCQTIQEKVLDDNMRDLQRTRDEIEEVCNHLARQ